MTSFRILNPKGAIAPTGTWSLGTRAGDFVFVAGMRGIDPETNQLVEGDEARITQAFLNMQLIATSEGASLQDVVRLVVYVTDMDQHRPLVNKVQEDLWGGGPYPPRTILEVKLAIHAPACERVFAMRSVLKCRQFMDERFRTLLRPVPNN